MTVSSEQIEADFLAELEEDYVGLWSIIRRFKDAGVADKAEQMAAIESMLRNIIAKNQVLIGNFRQNEFSPSVSPNPLERLLQEWRDLDREPNIGEIAWFSKR